MMPYNSPRTDHRSPTDLDYAQRRLLLEEEQQMRRKQSMPQLQDSPHWGRRDAGYLGLSGEGVAYVRPNEHQRFSERNTGRHTPRMVKHVRAHEKEPSLTAKGHSLRTSITNETVQTQRVNTMKNMSLASRVSQPPDIFSALGLQTSTTVNVGPGGEFPPDSAATEGMFSRAHLGGES